MPRTVVAAETLVVDARPPAGHPSLSIIIPAFNEHRRLPATLRAVSEYFRETVEIVVVDDGSRDGTAALASRILAGMPHAYAVIRHAENHGKGCAVRLGVRHARAPRLLVMDADHATPIAEWEKLRARLDAGADLALGSRAMPDSRIPVAQPWFRRPLGPAYNRLVRLLLFRGIRDTQCGFKALRADVARDLFARQRIDGFTFDPEVIFLALRSGFRVQEVGVVWGDRAESKVDLLRDVAGMLWDLFRVRLYAMRGLYARAAVPDPERA